jgi:MFS family permease
MAKAQKLFSLPFISVNFVCFFAFCNMAVFYGFYSYLGKIGIPVEWRGFLVGLEPMTAFALRLFLVPLLHAGNAVAVMVVAVFMLLVALNAYTWATTVTTLVLLRIFHGSAFVLLVSAAMALVVHFIPKERSAQGFGMVSLAALVPYAIMPIVSEALLRQLHGETRVYAVVSMLAVPGLVLLIWVKGRMDTALKNLDAALLQRPSTAEIRENLRQPDVLLLLGVNALVYLSHASVFYFMKNAFAAIERGDVGWFFTISSLIMIAVRLVGAASFDKLSKTRMIFAFLLVLVVCFVLFTRVRSPAVIYVLAGCYGLGLGVILPLLNAAMFVVSPAHLRGVNTNLALFMMDTGYFLSPYLGGLLLTAGYGISLIFQMCAGFLLLASSLILILGRRRAAG